MLLMPLLLLLLLLLLLVRCWVCYFTALVTWMLLSEQSAAPLGYHLKLWCRWAKGTGWGGGERGGEEEGGW